MKKLKEVLFTFVCVTTCITFVTALYTSIFIQGYLNPIILWQILLVSFFCSLGSFLYPKKLKSKRQTNFLLLVHYVYINLIVLGFGLLFEWFYLDNLAMVVMMLISIAIVFLLMVSVLQKYNQKQAVLLNEQLQLYIKKKTKS